MSILLIKVLIIVAAPCCGGGGNLPGLILGNERVQMSLSGTYSSVVGDTPTSGGSTFRADDDTEESYLLGLSAGFLISDRWQAGASLSTGYRNLDRPSVKNSGAGIGDLKLHLGYEFLPVWTYSAWKPKGFVFAHLNAPTGKSTHDSSEAGAVDAFGQGFWSTGLGVVLVKSWRYWDASLSVQGQYSFPQSFDSPRPIYIEPGFQASGQVGAGVSPWAGPFRVGVRVGPAWRDGGSSRLYGETNDGVYRLVWDAAAEINLMIGDTISLAANYTDQTLLGPTKNTALSRSGGMTVQYRWLR